MWLILNQLGILYITTVFTVTVSAVPTTDVHQLLQRVQIIEEKGYQYEATIATMKAQIEELEQSNREKQDIIDELHDKLEALTHLHHTDDLRNKNDPHYAHINTSKTDAINSTTMLSEHNIHKLHATTFRTKSKASNKHIKKEKGESRERRLTVTSQKVAFHATAVAKQEHLHLDENVALDTVLLNIGNSYHAAHGLFTAPVNGIYVFSVSVMNDDTINDWVQVGLMKNGNTLAHSLGDGRLDGYHQGSITVPVQLQEGDEVWVKITHPLTEIAFWGDYYTSFSGFLLADL